MIAAGRVIRQVDILDELYGEGWVDLSTSNVPSANARTVARVAVQVGFLRRDGDTWVVLDAEGLHGVITWWKLASV